MVLRRQEESDTSSGEDYEDYFEDAFQNEFNHEGHQQSQDNPINNDDIEKASVGRNNHPHGVGTPGMDAFEERFEDEPVLVVMEPSSPSPQGPSPPYTTSAATHRGGLTGGSHHPQYGAGMDPFAPISHHHPHDPLAPFFENEGAAGTGRVDPFEERFEDEPVLVVLEPSQGGKTPNGSSSAPTTGGTPRDPFSEAFEDEPAHVLGEPLKTTTPSTTSSRKRRGCSRLRCCFLTFLILLLIIAGCFIYQWTKIPKLNEEAETLEAQVQRLQATNKDLTTQVEELTAVSEACMDASDRLSTEKDNLEAANEEFRTEVSELTEQTDQLQASNTDLSAQVQDLQGDFQGFQMDVAKLIFETADANNYIMDALQDVTGNVDDISSDPQVTVQVLGNRDYEGTG
jgi:cell division protein FtsL